jgi:hypothetical protein
VRPKTIYQWALVNFFIAAVIGLALRLHPLGLLTGFHYKNWLHTHSHLAFLGWVYPAIIAFLVERRPQPAGNMLTYLFGSMQVLVLGMLITFPQYGYGWPSIVVLSLHMVATIWLVFYLKRNVRQEYRIAGSYVQGGAWLLIISALGALALGPVSALGLKYSPYYFSAIYFYLHFQYNGWFTLAIVGILVTYMPRTLSAGMRRPAWYALWFLVAGILSTYALSILGYGVPAWVHAVGASGALAQIVGFGILSAVAVRVFRSAHITMTTTVRLLFAMALASLVLKLLLQLLSAWPPLTDFAYSSHDLVIAYLHEYLIGTITLTLMALAVMHGWIDLQRSSARCGIWIFIAGFFLTEAALLLRALWPVVDPIWMQYILVSGAALMVGALACIAGGVIKRGKVVKRPR